MPGPLRNVGYGLIGYEFTLARTYFRAGSRASVTKLIAVATAQNLSGCMLYAWVC